MVTLGTLKWLSTSAIYILIHTTITDPVDVSFALYSVIITTVFKMARAV